MESLYNSLRKSRRKYSSKRAVSNVIAVTLMTAMVLVLGIATLSWAQGVSLNFVQNYGAAVEADMAKIRERLTIEYIYYDSTPRNVTIYLLNCGIIDDVTIQSITVRAGDGTTKGYSTNPTLRLLDGTVVGNLDQRQEGYVKTLISPNPLVAGQYYYLTIVTVRGAIFNGSFVA